jgi:signal transduction histidine kinase
MPLPHGLVFAVTLGEWFRIPEVLYAADFERGFHLRVEDRTLWLQSGSTDSYGGTTIAITDVTRFASAVDERESSLRFLLHDLRSPLNSISALTQLDASDPEAFEQCGGMQQITQLAHYVLSLGEQFIFNSVAEHLLARDFRRFDLRATLRQIVSQLEVTAVYCGVPLHLWMPDSASVWVSGMRNFAARAIQNLIDNAVRASRRGEPVAVSLRHAGQFVEVHVSDRAGGLPGLADGERLTHFDQLGKKTATGFGLGLKLAVQIVELHGGSLYAERNDDGGTLFVLRLPCLNTVRQGRAPLPLDEADRVLRAARR